MHLTYFVDFGLRQIYLLEAGAVKFTLFLLLYNNPPYLNGTFKLLNINVLKFWIMKKLFALIFATMLAMQAWAQEFQNGDLYYNITSDSTVEVTCPPFYWTNIEYYRSTLSTVVIPNTVKSLGDAVFDNSFAYFAFSFAYIRLSVHAGE